MSGRTTISLDKEAYIFLMKNAESSKSAYISALLKREKQRLLQEAIVTANKEAAEDTNYQNELSV